MKREIRCRFCHRLLGKLDAGAVEICCPRCGAIMNFRETGKIETFRYPVKPYQERLERQ